LDQGRKGIAQRYDDEKKPLDPMSLGAKKKLTP
jgi:hypothetical protein